MCGTARRRHFRRTVNASTRQRGAARALPAPSRASPRVCPPMLARAREVAGGCARSCSPCSLTPVAAPTHCTPAPSHRGFSPPLCPLSVSVSRSPPRLSPPSLCCLVYFHRSQPRSRRVEGSALPAQTAATSGRPRTNLPAPLLLPHGPTFLLLLRRRCRRRLEGDPDLTVFLRPDWKGTPKASHAEGRATFPLCFENRGGWEGRDGEGEKKKETILIQSRRLKGGLSVTWTKERLARRCRDTEHLFGCFYPSWSRVQDHTEPLLLCASRRAAQSSYRAFE